MHAPGLDCLLPVDVEAVLPILTKDAAPCSLLRSKAPMDPEFLLRPK